MAASPSCRRPGCARTNRIASATIIGGDGNDKLDGGAGDDWVDAGEGNDYVDGSSGRDNLQGGAGIDTLYGGRNSDTMDGGDGDDYLDGYIGRDEIVGGLGNDVLSGGKGSDRLFGGQGDDVIYTGTASDLVNDAQGTNSVFYQADDSLLVSSETRRNANTKLVEVAEVPDNIKIGGTAKFNDRMRADLETLAASPTGKQMLGEVQGVSEGGKNVLDVTRLPVDYANAHGGGLPGGPGIVEMNDSYSSDDDDGRVPPNVVLYHELAHARAGMTGNWAPGTFADDADPSNPDTGVKNAERQAVGLTIDHDNDPSTPGILDPHTPAALTENAIREEMGYERRDDYTF